MNWSSFETTGGIGGLSGQRCLHTAIPVTGEDIDNADDTQLSQGDPAASPSSSATAVLGTAAPPPTQKESIDDAAAEAEASGAAPAVKLWNPVGTAGAAGPVSARSAGSEKGTAAGLAATKKKAGAKEGASAPKKAGGKEAAKNSSGNGGADRAGDDNIDGAGPDVDGGAPPVFERIVIFGGIVGEAAVSGVSCGWTTTGKRTCDSLDRRAFVSDRSRQNGSI